MAEAARREDWPRTVAEFEAWRARQPERWEFLDGRPRLMTPASMKRSLIKNTSMKRSLIKNKCGLRLTQAVADLEYTALIDGPLILTEIGGSTPGRVLCRGAMESKRAPLGL